MSNHFHLPMLRADDITPHLAKGIDHWRPGFSAAELAQSWWNAQGIPEKINRILDQATEWKGSQILEAFFERKTDLDTPGRPSQTDLLILTKNKDGTGILAVEGKAREPFGPIVKKWLQTEPSEGKERRLDALCAALRFNRSRALELRYQLLHRTIAATIEAKRLGCGRVVVLVHHFASTSKRRSSSFIDFANFTSLVGAPVDHPNAISKSTGLNSVNVRFAWVGDEPLPGGGLGPRDLLLALGWCSHLYGSDNALARYWQQYFALMSDALGLPAHWNEDHNRTPQIITALANYAHRLDFFGQFLEYTPLPDEKKILDRHKILIKTSEANLRSRLLDHAEELLSHFWPQLRGKRTDHKHLVEMGLPPERPDYIDFI
jgi:hypothetical protein